MRPTSRMTPGRGQITRGKGDKGFEARAREQSRQDRQRHRESLAGRVAFRLPWDPSHAKTVDELIAGWYDAHGTLEPLEKMRDAICRMFFRARADARGVQSWELALIDALGAHSLFTQSSEYVAHLKRTMMRWAKLPPEPREIFLNLVPTWTGTLEDLFDASRELAA